MLGRCPCRIYLRILCVFNMYCVSDSLLWYCSQEVIKEKSSIYNFVSFFLSWFPSSYLFILGFLHVLRFDTTDSILALAISTFLSYVVIVIQKVTLRDKSYGYIDVQWGKQGLEKVWKVGQQNVSAGKGVFLWLK